MERVTVYTHYNAYSVLLFHADKYRYIGRSFTVDDCMQIQ